MQTVPACPLRPPPATLLRRRLLRDPAVSDAHYKSCMERMLGSAQKLSGLLHGHAVRVHPCRRSAGFLR